MSYKLDHTTSDENDYENTNPTIKKSLKNSFFSNFKSSKNKLKLKLSTSPSSQTSLDDTKFKSVNKTSDNEIDPDTESSLYYPVSSNSTLTSENSFRNQILKKPKDVRVKPTVNAFLKNSSFSSSTSSSPPSPFSIHKFKSQKKSCLPEQKEVPVISSINYDEQSDEFIDENSHYSTEKNFLQHNTLKLKNRNMDHNKSKISRGVCSGAKNFSFNTDYDEEDFMDAFRIFDINGDGRITAKELKNVLKELGIKMEKQDVKKMIKELDKDGNGTIEYSEFVQMMTSPASKDDDEFELREAFKCIDLDGNGYISRDELKDAVDKIMSTDGRISVQDVEEMMKEADTDGNGLIDYDEFVRILVEKR